MHGFDLAALLFAAFWAGAFVALLVRALIEDATQRRLGRETVEAGRRMELLRESGATKIVVDGHVCDDLAEANARLLARSRGTRMRAKRLLRDV